MTRAEGRAAATSTSRHRPPRAEMSFHAAGLAAPLVPTEAWAILAAGDREASRRARVEAELAGGPLARGAAHGIAGRYRVIEA